MIKATDLRAGATFLLDGKPYQVIKYAHIKMGRGGATVKVTVRNLESGSVEDKAFSSNLTFEDVELSKRKLQFLYKDDRAVFFIDPTSYEQIEVSLSLLEGKASYLREGDQIYLLFWGEKPLSIDLPPKVSLVVSETAPGVKGNSAVNIFKPARLENGLTVKVPLFINSGDKIIVDTRTGEYVERAK